MSDQTSVEFALRGRAYDRDFSPATGVPMARWLEFNREVQEFVQGSDAARIFNDLQVQVVEGSYLVRVLGTVAMLSAVAGDMAKLAKPGALARIDRKRATVARAWQGRAQTDPALAYELRSHLAGSAVEISITHDTTFDEPRADVWIDVEQYLVGTIETWGGSESVNVHLRPRNSKRLVKIDARPEQIARQRENLVYHQAIVHVTAKENMRTGEIADHRLLDLQPYDTKVSEEEWQRLFAGGARAWAEVNEPGAWVEDLRGGSHG